MQYTVCRKVDYLIISLIVMLKPGPSIIYSQAKYLPELHHDTFGDSFVSGFTLTSCKSASWVTIISCHSSDSITQQWTQSLQSALPIHPPPTVSLTKQWAGQFWKELQSVWDLDRAEGLTMEDRSKTVAGGAVSNRFQFFRQLHRVMRALAHSGKDAAPSLGSGDDPVWASANPPWGPTFREFDVAATTLVPVMPARTTALMVHKIGLTGKRFEKGWSPLELPVPLGGREGVWLFYTDSEVRRAVCLLQAWSTMSAVRVMVKSSLSHWIVFRILTGDGWMDISVYSGI